MSKDTKVYVKFEPVIVKGWAFGGQACDTDDIEVSVKLSFSKVGCKNLVMVRTFRQSYLDGIYNVTLISSLGSCAMSTEGQTSNFLESLLTPFPSWQWVVFSPFALTFSNLCKTDLYVIKWKKWVFLPPPVLLVVWALNKMLLWTTNAVINLKYSKLFVLSTRLWSVLLLNVNWNH